MTLYNLIEYSNNYSKTTGGLWQCHRDQPFLDANGDIADFPADNKTKIASRTGNFCTKNVKTMVPL